MTEYWLLKKQLGGWDKVTWYAEDELEKAQSSFKALVDAKGYAIRLVKVDVVQEHLLEEMIEVAKPEIEPVKTTWERHAKPVEAKYNGWGNVTPAVPNNSWGPVTVQSKPSHGLSGSVWLVNYSLKQKKRVASSEVDVMIAQGWERGGPRTVV